MRQYRYITCDPDGYNPTTRNIEAYSMVVDRGTLLFSNARGRAIKAIPAGYWREAELVKE